MSHAQDIFDDLACRFIINSPNEEFASFERVLFQMEQAHWFYEDFYRKKHQLPKYTLERFVELMFHHCPNLQPYASSVGTIYKDFRTYKSKVPVCGCILLSADLNKCVMVQGYGSHTWGFPRGKINKDEQPSACALREVYEETGYDASSNLLLDDFIDFTNRQQSVRLYLCPDVALNTAFETRTRKEIRKIAWFNVAQLPMSFEASKEPGVKMFSVPPTLVAQLRSWIKKRRKKGRAGKQKKGAGNPSRAAMNVSGNDAEEEDDDDAPPSDPNFPTDREISNAQLRERELERWKASDEDDVNSSELQLKGSTGAWNQWEANHRMFGVVSTYNIEDYTTKLDESKAEYAERLLQAYGIRSRAGNKKKQADGVPAAALAPLAKAAAATPAGGKQRKQKQKAAAPVAPAVVAAPVPPAYAVDLKAALDAFDDDDL